MESYEIYDLLFLIAVVVYGIVFVVIGGSECLPILIFCAVMLFSSEVRSRKRNDKLKAQIQELKDLIQNKENTGDGSLS